MNKPGLAAALAAALFYSLDGAAFQLGQLRSTSSQGHPLAARIELYGLSAADAARLELTLKPDIRLAHRDPARGVIDAIEASVARDAAGQPYIALRSAAPIGLAHLAFRLRARLGERASIAHLELDLPASAPAVRRERRPRALLPAAPTATTGTVGPVRPGDSLWRILDAHGLTGGDVAATMARVVADNPHAFVDGDANRLRVGVMLTLPATRGSTAQAAPRRAPGPAPVVTQPPVAAAGTRPAVATRRTLPGARDEALQARLDALGEKFAAIRARYENATPSAASSETTVEAPPVEAASPATLDSAVADAESTETAPLAKAVTIPAEAVATPPLTAAAESRVTQPPTTAAQPATAATSEPVEPQPAAPRAATTPAEAADAVLPEIPVSRLLLLAVAGTISLVALVSGIGTALRRLRARRRAGSERTADEEKVAEIARKATRRLELEEDVRRRLGGQGNVRSRDAGADTGDARFGTIDSHIAHGHYREAEAQLGDIIAAAPDNYRAGLRLLELYYLERRGEDFAALAGALQREHRDEIDDEAWQRVMRMGKVLAPNQPPFSGPVALARTA